MSMMQSFFESAKDVVKKKSVYKYVKSKEVLFFKKKIYRIIEKKGPNGWNGLRSCEGEDHVFIGVYLLRT
jgi:hypothetical protein